MARKATRSGNGGDASIGFNQKKVRAYNERLVLSLIQRHGALAKSDITRKSGLSAQAVSVIIGELEKDGLLLRGEPIRGRVGQPSVPMRLNPDGVFSFGLKIGRRSADLILIDFAGQTRSASRITYSYPMPELVMAFAFQGIREMSQKIGPEQQDKIAGIGVALPFHLWDWEEKVGVATGTMDVWKTFDIAQELEAATGLNAFTQNDCTAACCAEVAFGRGMAFSDSLYIFVGTFVGGGVALNNSIYAGRTRNAGALASMPMPGPDGAQKQLLDFASLFFLEQMLKEKAWIQACCNSLPMTGLRLATYWKNGWIVRRLTLHWPSHQRLQSSISKSPFWTEPCRQRCERRWLKRYGMPSRTRAGRALSYPLFWRERWAVRRVPWAARACRSSSAICSIRTCSSIRPDQLPQRMG